MLGVVLVRRLREGKTYADFVDGDHDFSAEPAPLPLDRQGFPWT